MENTAHKIDYHKAFTLREISPLHVYVQLMSAVCFPQGMTNRRDLIDDALLRPGRLEVQVEIGEKFLTISHMGQLLRETGGGR